MEKLNCTLQLNTAMVAPPTVLGPRGCRGWKSPQCLVLWTLTVSDPQFGASRVIATKGFSRSNDPDEGLMIGTAIVWQSYAMDPRVRKNDLKRRYVFFCKGVSIMAKAKKPAPTTSDPAPAARASKPATEAKGSGTIGKAPGRNITEEMIRQRAYEIYASRGYAAGNPNDDWNEAQRQLQAGL